jgi:hypothetical protein
LLKMKKTLHCLRGIILALACVVGLAGCSAVRLGYNNLPDIAYWWLDGYADFTDTQAATARDSLARLHAWHRREELPRLAELLGRMEQMAPGPITPQQACAVLGELQARGFALADQAEPAVLTLAASLEPAQLRHLERKYRGNNDTYRREWIELSPEEQRDKRFDQLVERSEMVYGKLQDAQRAVLRQGLATSVFDARRLLAQRQRRQQDLLQTLRKVADPALPGGEVKALVRGYLDRVVQPPDAAARKYQEELMQEGCRLFAAVHASTVTAQRQQAVQRLRAYQRDLRELAAQP